MGSFSPAIYPKNAPNAKAFREARPGAIVQPATVPVVKKVTSFMRRMQRLANLAPTIMASLDVKADAIADNLVAQQKRAEDVIDQFGALANTLGKVADDVGAALGQITNDPTQGSGA